MALKGGALVAVLMLLACNRENDRPANQASTEAPQVAAADGTPERKPVTNATGATANASESIAEARCARESRCENIGDNRKYSSQQDCIARIRADWKEDLNARECPYGIKQKQLDECLSSIRGEECGDPFDTLGRVAECTAGQICNDG